MQAIRLQFLVPLLLVMPLGLVLMTQAVESKSSQELVWVGTPEDVDSEHVRAQFEAAGFVVAMTQEEVNSVIGDATRAVIVTPRGLDFIAARAPELIERGVLLGGPNVSLHDLMHVADPQLQVGDGWLRASGERDIFSLVSRTKCSERRFSDWLDNWDVVGLTMQRAEDAVAAYAAHQTLSCDRNVPRGE